MKFTSTDKMNKAFREKDEKYRGWATRETREKNVSKVVMVPLILSHDGAVHRETVRRLNDYAPDITTDSVRIAKNVLRYNIVIVGMFFNKASLTSVTWRREHLDEFE